jgi:dTDP-4-amino-4,6-dideoxygalactose transaminase
VVEQGFNYRLPDLLCALGRAQLRRLPGFLHQRRALAAAYRRALALHFGTASDALVQAPVVSGDRESAHHLFAVAIDFAAAGVDRGALMTALAERGIGTQVHYIPLPQHPFHRRKAGDHAAMPRPGADTYYARTLSLPMYPGLDDATAGVIVEALAACLTELRR